MTDDTITQILAEMAGRQPIDEERERADAKAVADAMAADLRSFYHPKQRAFLRSKAKLKATKKTRRVGATVGSARELLARSIEQPGHRAVCVGSTRVDTKARIWENDTKTGFIDVLRAKAKLLPGRGVDRYDLGGVTVEVREQDLELKFSNGSHIVLFGADDERAIQRQRGLAKHVYWIDEAQDFRFLTEFYKGVVSAALTDFQGECWLTGTPGKDCAGMFYEVTADEDERLPGWEVHEIAVVDNPYFGCVVWRDAQWFVVDNVGVEVGPFATEADAENAARDVRWENTAGKAKRDNHWTDDDPDFQREWLAKWVKGDARYVYPVHVVPKHRLTFAPQRLCDNPFAGTDERFDGHPRWYDHEAAVRDLPRRATGEYQWLYAIGADFGYFPDPFALVVWAFSYERPDIFEMFSWKHTKVLPDDQRAYIELAYRTIDNVVVLVGDGGNGKAADFVEWEQRFNLPIESADKAGKNTQEELFAGDIRAGHVHYREDSPLLVEHRHLVYLPSKPGKPRTVDKHRKLPDGTVPGDHVSDAGRYAHKHLRHFLFKPPPKDDRDAGQRVADEYQKQLIEAHAIRQAVEEFGGEEW